MPATSIEVTLECAGNDRLGLVPLPKGEPWGGGAVSTGTWHGVPLAQLLDRAGIADGTVEVLFTGADYGKPEGLDTELAFERSLPLGTALHEDTLLVYELNGAPLTREHGGPVRLLVPDWYGMASVKWLTRIVALDRPFEGHFQTTAYVLEWPGQDRREPLGALRVKSIITDPLGGQRLPLGPCVVSGFAWSGAGPIARVEVCVEGAGAWQPASLIGDAVPHAWQPWQWKWVPVRPGRHVLRVRATDHQGNIQPDVPEWNRLGYANNAIQLVVVQVEG